MSSYQLKGVSLLSLAVPSLPTRVMVNVFPSRISFPRPDALSQLNIPKSPRRNFWTIRRKRHTVHIKRMPLQRLQTPHPTASPSCHHQTPTQFLNNQEKTTHSSQKKNAPAMSQPTPSATFQSFLHSFPSSKQKQAPFLSTTCELLLPRTNFSSSSSLWFLVLCSNNNKQINKVTNERYAILK